MAFVHSLPDLANVRANDTLQQIPYTNIYRIARTSTDHATQQQATFSFDDNHLTTSMPALYRYCRSLTASHWDAQDLMQNTLLKALTLPYQHWQRSESEQQAYLLRIARNLRIDETRRAMRLQQRLPLLHELLIEQQAHQRATLEQTMQAEAAIKLLLDTLSPWQHAVYALRELLGYTASEAASLLNTTEGAVKSALRRARAALLQKRSSDDDDAELTIPAYEEYELLATYLAAFRNGNAAHLVQLILNQAADPAGLAPQIVGQLHSGASKQTVQGQRRYPHAWLYGDDADLDKSYHSVQCMVA
ncbi:RNA polymerase sigma factor [Paenibacillus wenxiniae]|uniref:RNA polymerase sigma factor n=1 Tax=Paenibacillus wenxiniae TaxID=1636843 RepID=A0ABW4RQU9_9BACL